MFVQSIILSSRLNSELKPNSNLWLSVNEIAITALTDAFISIRDSSRYGLKEKTSVAKFLFSFVDPSKKEEANGVKQSIHSDTVVEKFRARPPIHRSACSVAWGTVQDSPWLKRKPGLCIETKLKGVATFKQLSQEA